MPPKPPADLDDFWQYAKRRQPYPTGTRRDRQGRNMQTIHFPPSLFLAILAEAKERGISFNRVCIETLRAGLAP